MAPPESITCPCRATVSTLAPSTEAGNPPGRAPPGEAPLAFGTWANICSYIVERRYELETLRRSLAMLRPGAPALDREEAMRLVRELQAFERQVRTLREGLLRLLEEAWPGRGRSAQRDQTGGVGQDLADFGEEA